MGKKKILNEKGYKFIIPKIRGRLGNILIATENLITICRNTSSSFEIKKIKFKYDVFDFSKVRLDYTSTDNENCNKEIVYTRSLFTQGDYHESMFIDKENKSLNYLYDIIKKENPKTEVYDNTLVVNIRGGIDIFTKGVPHARYVQPPLNYYKMIIDLYDGHDILLVTDHIGYNPVIDELLKLYPRIRIAENCVTSHVNIFLKAKYLITCRSTFSLFFSRLSKSLNKIYVWSEDNCMWDQFEPLKSNCLSENVDVVKYYSNEYTKCGEWSASKENLSKMINHPIDLIKIRT